VRLVCRRFPAVDGVVHAAWFNRDILPLIPEPFGPGFGMFYLLEELGEAVRNCLRSGGLEVLSQPPADYGADLFP
jgi:hypothetical protein